MVVEKPNLASPIAQNLQRIHALETVLRLCKGYGVSFNSVISNSRYKTVVKARHHAWALIRNSMDMSFPEIGEMWSRDHTSIIYGVRKHEKESHHDY